MAEDVPIFQTMVMENPNPEGSARLVRLVRARSQQGKEQSHEAATSPLWRARLASIDRKVHLACNGDVGWRTRFFGPLAQGSGVASRLGFINNDGLRGIEAWWTSAIFDNGLSDISGSRVQSPTVKWQPGLRPWVMNFCNAPQALQRQTTPRRAIASTGNPDMTTPRFSLWRMSISIFLGSA